MTTVEDLTEVATRAATAECTARSVKWQDRSAIEKIAAGVNASLAAERALLHRPPVSAVATSPTWTSKLSKIAIPDPPPDRLGTATDDPAAVAARAEADASAAVTAARIALGEAHLAMLTARLAALDAGDCGTDQIRGYSSLAEGNPVWRHVRALARGVRDELRHIVHDKPRSVATKLGISLGIGLAYLGFLRTFHWDDQQEYLP